MAKIYIAITGITNEDVLLKDVDSSGTLIGNIIVEGTKIGSSDVFVFDILWSRFYSLYIDNVVVETAETMYLNSGLNIITNDDGEVESLSDLNMGDFSINNLKPGAEDDEAVTFGQIKSLISNTVFPSTLPSVTLDPALASDCIVSIPNSSSITSKDISYIFFYVVSNSVNTPNVSIDSNGLITLSGSKVVQSAVKTPSAILPKTAGWTKDMYVHFGYYLMNSSGISSKKIGSYYTIPSSYIGLDEMYENLSAVTPSTGSIPIVTDFGSTIGVTIPAGEKGSFVGDYEIVYGFMSVDDTDPTISTNTITNMTTYTIQRSSGRSLIIPKPVIASSVVSYKICVSYRFVNPFTTSLWWRSASTNKLKIVTLTKFPERLNQSDLEAIVSQIVSRVEVDLDTGNLLRKA